MSLDLEGLLNNPLERFEKDLRVSYAADDTEGKYQSLSQAVVNQPFRLHAYVLEMLDSTNEEVNAMRQSVQKGREVGMVTVAGVSKVYEGGEYELAWPKTRRILRKLGMSAEKPLVFSHTHWDSARDPLPSNEDLNVWWYLRTLYSNSDLRILMWQGDRVRTLRWHGWLKKGDPPRIIP